MTIFSRSVLCALAASFCVAPDQAAAEIRIHVDLAAQQLEATKPSGETVTWKISSGRRGYETPTGRFEVYRMEEDHLSDEYDQAPMPYAMFFSPRGLAIHGSMEHGLGRPASHGCVRLSVDHARQLYQWAKQNGGARVEIVGRGAPGAVRESVAERARAPRRMRRDPVEFEAITPVDPPPDRGALESDWRY